MPVKGSDRQKQLEQQARRTLRGLIRTERLREGGICGINLNSLEKSISSLISSLSNRLAQKISQSDVYLKDLERLEELSHYSADDISRSVINEERALLKRYFNLFNHYKISLIEKYCNKYLKLSSSDAGLSRIQQENLREERQNYRTSLEAAHGSLLSMLKNKATAVEKSYISDIITRFNQFVTKQFREHADRVRTCNSLQMPAEEFLHRSRSSVKKSSRSPAQYEQATLQNRQQEMFYEDKVSPGKKRSASSSSRQNSRKNQDKRLDAYAQDIMEGRENDYQPEERKIEESRQKSPNIPQTENNIPETGDAGNNTSSGESPAGNNSSSGENSPGESLQEQSSAPSQEQREDTSSSLPSSSSRDPVFPSSGDSGDEISQDNNSDATSTPDEVSDQSFSSELPGFFSEDPGTGSETKDAEKNDSSQEKGDSSLSGGSGDNYGMSDFSDKSEGSGSKNGDVTPELSDTEKQSPDIDNLPRYDDVPDGATGTGEFMSVPGDDPAGGEDEGSSPEVQDKSADQGSIYDLLLGGGAFDDEEPWDDNRAEEDQSRGTSESEDDYELIPDVPAPPPVMTNRNFASGSATDGDPATLPDDYLDNLADDIIFNRSGQWSEPGDALGTPAVREKSIFSRCFDLIDECTGLQKLLQIMGKSMGLDRQQIRKIRENFRSQEQSYSEHSRESFSGITMGNEINYVLPEELVKITDGDTEHLFDISYLERNLLSFDLSGYINVSSGGNEKILTSPRPGRGPLVLCVDTSSSMRGIPESYAKAIAMSLALKCRSAHRDCYIINFSVSIEKMLLKSDTSHALERLSSFLSKNFDGGSDLDEALLECLALMQNDPRFFHSDVLCITDGQIKFSRRLKKLVDIRRRQERNHFYELVIGSVANEQYWIEARQKLYDQSRLFDHLYELGHDGKWVREISL